MKNHVRYSLKETSYRHLFEQEEEEAEAAEDTAEENIFGDEEDAEQAEGEGEAEDETEAEQEEEKIAVSSAEQYELSDSIDQELEALLIDFEEEARKSAVVNEPEELAENRRLHEAAAEDIDLRSFAADVARLVKNYQNLIDWESVILNKTESFINNHYGEDTVRVLFDILDEEYGIAREAKEEIPEAPIAVGATSEGGG